MKILLDSIYVRYITIQNNCIMYLVQCMQFFGVRPKFLKASHIFRAVILKVCVDHGSCYTFDCEAELKTRLEEL